jgi:predicted metal-binding protein
MAEVFDTRLTPEETLELTNRLMGFYENLETIQDYFLERKKEKVVGLDHDKYTKLMFNDFSIQPKDMNFVVEQIEGKLFNPSTQIITSLPLEAQIGRQITLGIKETNTDKYVGFIRLASPVLSIKPRNDLFEGLKVTANEVNKYMINGAIIVPVQPFGYNYLGGKLLALICCSHEAREMLKEKYGERIDTVFMETTSLYGDIKGVSQYDGLKPFMKYGSMTESDIFMFPSDEIFMSIRNVLRPIYGKEEWGGSMVDPGPSGPKMREFNKIISILKNHLKVQNPVKFKEFFDFTKSHMKAKTKKRYYYSTYGYENAFEYIAADGKIPLIKRENFDKYSLENMIEWWKKKAQSRYIKLKTEERLRYEMEIYTAERIESGNVDMVR